MASLSFIMDVTDDHHAGTRAPLNKTPRGTDDPTSAGKVHEAGHHQQADPRQASSPGPATTDQDIKEAVLAGPTKRRATSLRDPKSTAPISQTNIGASVPSSTSASPSAPASTGPRSPRRLSTTSNDSMDRSRSGPAPSSSSLGGGPRRPMALHPVVAQYTPKITPKTGRVSKAKKGLPVHVCDICRPPKTFTRAEHLRRHQLGHGEPQYQCPGCEKAFHRADLLARHQQKHEHDDDELPRDGSAHHSPHPSPAALSLQAQRSPRMPAVRPAAAPSAIEVASTPKAAAVNQSNFSQHNEASQQGGNAPYTSASRASSQDFHSTYTYSPTISIVNPSQSSSQGGTYSSSLGGYQPRTGLPPPVYVVTQELQPPGLLQTDVPELHDASPLPSSASDSAYSTTPVSDVSRNPVSLAPGHRSPYPSATTRGFQSSRSGMEASQSLAGSLFIGSHSTHHAQEQNAYVGRLGIPSPVGYSSLSASPNTTARAHHHQHSRSLSSLRGRTPPLDTSSPQAVETLLASAPRLSSQLDPMAGFDRRKGAMMETHQDLSLGGLDVLGGLAVGYAAASPGADNASHGSDIVAQLDLALGGGCALPVSASMTIPLPGPVRAAIPRYLELYWARVDPDFPLVHRQSFEAAPEDVLKCAMAAVATQYLDNKEDRTRGNQLHEFAWQEVKRIPQWSLQTMQAILLCEYFARFRGRKAVTRPSKPFESLCFRAMYQNPGLLDHAMLAAEQQHLSIQDRWRNWIDTESRRRLLATCIVTDGQAAIYQQQRRAQDGDADAAMQLVPLLGRSSKLWAAASAEEWVSVLAADPEALQPEYVPPLEHLTLEEVAPRPTIDRMIILSALAQRLPRRQRPLSTSSLSANNSPAPEMDPHIGSQFRADHQPPAFLRQNQQPYYQAEPEASFDAEERINALFPACPIANTYLALHHTPLRDLLAVGGDSWVFSQKVLPATSFQEHQRRLKIWVTSCANTGGSSVSAGAGAALAGLSVVSATIYAARAIVGFLSREQRDHDRPRPLPGSSNSITADVDSALWANDISDYWALYVCALICWAFVHPARAGGAGPDFGQEGGVGSSSSSSISNSEQQQQNSRSAAAVSGIRGDVEIATLLPEAVSVTSTRPGNGAYQPSDNDALAWLRTVASPDVKPENVVRARGRREALGVVGLVRKRLESDCVGGRSRLYVDAVGVLRKLEDGLGWKWF